MMISTMPLQVKIGNGHRQSVVVDEQLLRIARIAHEPAWTSADLTDPNRTPICANPECKEKSYSRERANDLSNPMRHLCTCCAQAVQQVGSRSTHGSAFRGLATSGQIFINRAERD